MDVTVSNLLVKTYQLTDLINILLTSNYKIEIERNKDDKETVLVTAYINFNKNEEEK